VRNNWLEGYRWSLENDRKMVNEGMDSDIKQKLGSKEERNYKRNMSE